MNDQQIPGTDTDAPSMNPSSVGLSPQPLIDPRPRQSFSLSPGERAGVSGSVDSNHHAQPAHTGDSPNRGHTVPKPRAGGSLFDFFPSLLAFKNICDYIGASREDAPAGLPLLASPWWFGLWWGLLAGLILLFCGQTSKFIYIDF